MPPKNPDTVHVYFGSVPDLKTQLQALADQERRSFSQMVCLLVEEAIKARQAPRSPRRGAEQWRRNL